MNIYGFDFIEKLSENTVPAPLQFTSNMLRAYQAYWSGVYRYTNEFMLPFWTALNAFLTTEKDKLVRHQPVDTLNDYFELLQFNIQVAEKGLVGSQRAANDYHTAKSNQALTAWLNTLSGRMTDDLMAFAAKQANLLEKIVFEYPQAIRAIKPDYGFHFDDGGYKRIAETERFTVYQVLPRHGGKTRPGGKPILIIPPYVLGANILAFLPGEKKVTFMPMPIRGFRHTSVLSRISMTHRRYSPSPGKMKRSTPVISVKRSRLFTAKPSPLTDSARGGSSQSAVC